jgi:hypothetical protein
LIFYFLQTVLFFSSQWRIPEYIRKYVFYSNPFHAILNQNTPFIVPNKFTFLISIKITEASLSHFGTCVPSSGRGQCQFLKTQMLLRVIF